MADIAALNAKRGNLIDQLSSLAAEKSSLESSLVRAEQQLNNPGGVVGGDRQARRIQQRIDTIRSELRTNASMTQRFQSELDAVNNQINQAQQQQGAKVSTGQTVKQSQAARDDGASATNPPPDALKTAADGRIVKATAPVLSNAEEFVPGVTDSGTNDPTRRASNLQSTPPITARPGGINRDDAPQPTNRSGAAATSEDAAGGGVRARLNNLFGGTNNRIVPQDNILDNYASYTYNISIYIMSPEDYGRMLRDKQRRLYGAQLLMQSGGAPVSTAINQNNGQTDPGEIPGVTTQSAGLNVTGRNQFFPLDYYIDDVEVRSLVSNKGTGGAHNVTELKFKIIENNGITFLDNLFAATQQYVKIAGSDVNKNYAAQNYLMVIRFYGYDDQGNLVTVGKSGRDAAGSDVNAIVEKFIPFQFTGIRFRIANKLVEYDCSAVCPQNNVNTGASRGVIPYNVELQSQTLKDLLTGTEQFAAATQTEGRATTVARTAATPAATSRGFDNQTLNPEIYGP